MSFCIDLNENEIITKLNYMFRTIQSKHNFFYLYYKGIINIKNLNDKEQNIIIINKSFIDISNYIEKISLFKFNITNQDLIIYNKKLNIECEMFEDLMEIQLYESKIKSKIKLMFIAIKNKKNIKQYNLIKKYNKNVVEKFKKIKL